MAKITFGASTDIGNVREHNEDSFLAEPSLGLWLVADGMGGHACGEVASDIASRTIGESVGDGDDLVDAIQKSHQAILDSAKNGIGKKGMGTTVVALQLQNADYKIAWVGDSRAYLWDGKLEQISKDQSLVQMLVDTGNITEEEAMYHPQKNIIYQNLGADDVDKLNIGELKGTLNRGQKILLCSDGLSDEMTRGEIATVIIDVISTGGNDQKIADNLIKRVLESEAKDNVTVIIVTASDGAPDKDDDGVKESERPTREMPKVKQ
jgi:serine/threonine protein phosphatase PrpC